MVNQVEPSGRSRGDGFGSHHAGSSAPAALPLSTVWPAVKVCALAASTHKAPDTEDSVLRALGVVELFLGHAGVLEGEPTDEELEQVGALLRTAFEQTWGEG